MSLNLAVCLFFARGTLSAATIYEYFFDRVKNLSKNIHKKQ